MKKISLLGAMLLLVAAHYGNAVTPNTVEVQWKESGFKKSFSVGTPLGTVREYFHDKLGFPAKYMAVSGQKQSGDKAPLIAGKNVKVEPTYMGKVFARKALIEANNKAGAPKTQPYSAM